MQAMLLDTLMPMYDFHETHSVLVQATPERTYAALREVTPEEVALLRTLFAIRALPARLTGRRGQLFAARQPLLQQMLRGGFVLLAAEPGRELVLGAVGQFWRAACGSSVRVANAQEFLAFDRPDYARAAMNFRLEQRPSGVVTVTTETRVRIPDAVARKKFAVYWRVIVLGSALIRKMMLQAVKRQAEGSR
jgi:hypothetical protein